MKGNHRNRNASVEALCSDAKLDETRSTFYKDWNPFQTQTDLTEKSDITEVCNNFFGKDNCLKKDVTDACGVNEWKKLKDVSREYLYLKKVSIYFQRLLSLNDRVKKCNFEGIV